MTVRENHATDSSRPDLDAVIDTAIQSAHQHGYTLQQLRDRVQERLRVEPPDHVLLVGRETGMGVILRVELRLAAQSFDRLVYDRRTGLSSGPSTRCARGKPARITA